VCRSTFFAEFRLFNVGLVDSKRFPPRRQQTGSVFPERSLVCPMVRTDWASLRQHKLRGTYGNRSGKPLPVYCHDRRFCLESNGVATVHTQVESIDQTPEIGNPLFTCIIYQSPTVRTSDVLRCSLLLRILWKAERWVATDRYSELLPVANNPLTMTNTLVVCSNFRSHFRSTTRRFRDLGRGVK